MKVLVVGAGAVGSVYAMAAAQGGAEVTFLVKPKYVASLQNGFELYRLTRKGAIPKPISFKNFKMITDPVDVKKEKWDFVILAVAANTLRQGNWLKNLLSALSPETAVVCLQSGFENKEWLLSQGGQESQIISGLIPFSSFHYPLGTQTPKETCYGFWVYPLARAQFSGSSPKIKNLVSLLSRGGLASSEVADLRSEVMIPDCVLQSVVAGVEKSGWSIEKFLHGENVSLASRAIQETLAIQSKVYGIANPAKNPIKRQFTQPWFIRLIVNLAVKLAPFDFEAFLKSHYTKIKPQTTEGFSHLKSTAQKLGYPMKNIETLTQV